MAEEAAFSGAAFLGKLALKFGRDHVKIDKRTYETRMMYEMIRTEIRQIKRYVEEVATRSYEMATAQMTLELLFITNQITDLDDPTLVHKVERLIAEPQWGPAKTGLTGVLASSKNPIFQVKATGLLIMMYSLELLVTKLGGGPASEQRPAFEQLIDVLLHKLFEGNVKFKIDKELFSTFYLPEKLKLKMADSIELRETVKEFLQTVIYCFTRKIEDLGPEEGNSEQLVEMIQRELPTGFKKLKGWHGVLKWIYDWEEIIESPTAEADFAPALATLINNKHNTRYICDVVPRSFSREEIEPDHEQRQKAHATELIRPKPNLYQLMVLSSTRYVTVKHKFESEYYDMRLERIPHLPSFVGATKKGIYPNPFTESEIGPSRGRFIEVGMKLAGEDRHIWRNINQVYRVNLRTGVKTALNIRPRRPRDNDYDIVNAFAVDNLDFVVQRVLTTEGPGVVITTIGENGEHEASGRIHGVSPWIQVWSDQTNYWSGVGQTYAWRGTITGDLTIVFICDDGHIKIHAEGTLRDIEIPEINRPVAIVEHPSRFLVLDRNGAMFEITAEEDAGTLGWTATEIGRMKRIKTYVPDRHIPIVRAVANDSEVIIKIYRRWIDGNRLDYSLHFVPLPPTIQRGSASAP